MNRQSQAMMPSRLQMLIPIMVLVLSTTASLPRAWAKEPLFDGMGSLHRTVTTNSPEAQRYFDQGLTFYFGYNRKEAIRSFEQAAAFDSTCAMAFWGKALALGPHINFPFMDDEASQAADAAVRRAASLADRGTPVERDLIAALTHRYAWPAPSDRAELDAAYADAMRAVWKRYRGDADVGALFAESMMDLRPWDLWTQEGKPQPGTKEIQATLERTIKLAPHHPGVCHFYIHTMEASPHPEKALASADRLRDLVPGIGHLVHMPSHIDIRLGRYPEAIAANQRAIAADRRYVEQGGGNDYFSIYRAHDYHFLAYAAMFDGQREVALKAARDLVENLPLDLVRAAPDIAEGFLGTPTHVMVRFGLWDELLLEPEPADELLVTTAFWHYGRTVALSALGRVDEAAREYEALRRASAAVPESRYIGNNPATVLLTIADPMAQGELEYRRGNYDQAFALLRTAVERDDALRYDEPWGWMQPVRHALGALLLEQGRIREAEAVYRQDLQLRPGNGWGLLGLAECQRRAGKAREADRTMAAYEKAWSRSDVVIHASCFCRKSTM